MSKKNTVVLGTRCWVVYLITLLLLGLIPRAETSQGSQQLPLSVEKKTISSENSALAKEHALNLAEASLNDGFRVRDGSWSVSLTPQEPQVLEVTLFQGNDYWFIAAAAPPAIVLKMAIYDSNGHLLALDPWKETQKVSGARVAEEFRAPSSGNYFIKLELLKSEGKKTAETCLVYAYK